MSAVGFVVQEGVLLRMEENREEVTVPEGISEISGISLGERYYDLSRDSYLLRQVPGAFSFNKTIRRVFLPSSLRKIGPGAFADCTKLEMVSFSDGLMEIGEEAFINCVSLEKIELPGSTEKIGARAFSGCKKLAQISLRPGVREIEEAAFAYCSSLCTMEIPESVCSYGKEIFWGCRSLEVLRFPQKMPVRVFCGSQWYHRKMTEEGRCPVCGEKITSLSGMCMNPGCLTQYGKWER